MNDQVEILEEPQGEVQPRLKCEQSRVTWLDEEKRQIRHVISTPMLDRGGRMIEPSGWRLARYRANNVVLADHGDGDKGYTIEKIIGSGIDVKVEGLALMSTTQFASEGLGNVAFRLVQAGIVKSWSVGWMGLRRHRIGEVEDCERCKAAGKVDFGVHYTQQELLEYSLVAIPANPEAVMGLEAAGLIASAEGDEWSELVAAPPPKRSAAFYEALNSATRVLARRAAALRGAQRIRRNP